MDHTQQHMKRMRTGSISGRLRTASDLEDSGIIDKYQKGIIKDLIISGDVALQLSLDKCEKGDTSSLTDLIKRGCLARKQSIDLLDGLDFEFLNGIKTDDDDLGGLFDDDLMFDFVNDQLGYSGSFSADNTVKKTSSNDFNDEGRNIHARSARTSSMDSFSGNFRMFDNMTMYRGHSFGDENNLLLSGADEDNLYYADEHFLDDGVDPSNLYSIGNHHSGLYSDPTEIHSTSPTNLTMQKKGSTKKLSAKTQSEYIDDYQSVDLSAYATHAAALSDNNGNNVPAALLKSPLKLRINRNSSKADNNNNQNLYQARSTIASSTSQQPQFRQFSSHGVFTSDSNKPSMLHQQPSSQQILQQSSRKSKSIPTFNQFSGAVAVNNSESSMNFHPGYANSDNKFTRNNNAIMPYKLQGNTSGLMVNSGSSSGGVGFIGAYSPEQRRLRIEKFIEKRNRRVWTKKVKYDVRKNFADSRLRVKGRFVKKEDEDIMRELLDI